MNAEILKNRTKTFAKKVIELSCKIQKAEHQRILFNQLLRSSTAVAANYRSAIRGLSRKAFTHKIKLVEEEADESHFWLEMLNETGIPENQLLLDLLKEANELTAIFTAIGKTLKRKE